MNKKGFTLTELLVVVAIIGILSVIIVPSVIKINKNINNRLLSQKEEYIKSAAEMYAEDNPDLFSGTGVTYVTVDKLISSNYLEYDEIKGKANCSSESDVQSAAGCLIDPTDKTSMNSIYVKLTKKNVGVIAEIINPDDSETLKDETLVKRVCDGIGKNYDAYSSADQKCKCVYNGSSITGLVNTNEDYSSTNGSTVSQCILAPKEGTNTLDNWLSYGGVKWRVVGLYKNSNNEIYTKIITNDTVELTEN